MLHKVLFKIKRRIYRMEEGARYEFGKGQQLAEFVKNVYLSFVKVLLVAGLLYLVEYSMGYLWLNYRMSFPIWIQSLVDVIPKPSYPENKEQIIELISVIASISGVVLALFYPVLATIASTAYAKVHTNIRNLLFTDKRINAYLNNLTRLASLAVLNLFALTLGFQPGNLILLIISSYSIIMLYNILKIGLGVYELFDPSKLMRGVAEDLLEVLRKARVGKSFSGDINFQQHYRYRTIDSLEKFRTLTKLCEQDNLLNEVAYKTIAQQSFSILNIYLLQKRLISPSSKWYPQVKVERSLLAQDDILRQTFQSTLTNVQTESTTDYFWFEKRLTSIFLDESTAQPKEKVANKFKVLSESMGQPLASMGFLGITNSVEEILEKMQVQTLLLSKVETDENYETYQDRVIYGEALYGLLVSYCWNAFDAISNMTKEKFEKQMKMINWLDTDSLYQTSFYPDMFTELEKIIQRVRFEKKIEGGVITTQWYLDQEVAFLYLKKAGEIIIFSIKLIERFLFELIDRWHKEKYYLLSLWLLTRVRELVFKLRLKIDKCGINFLALQESYKKSVHTDWKLIDFSAGLKTLEDLDEVSVRVLPDCHLVLSVTKWNKKSPDLFSMAHLALCKEIEKTLLNNDIIRFKQFFRNFPHGCVASFNELSGRHETEIFSTRYASQPILDLLELSGLVYIYSKLHNNALLWDECCTVWDNCVKNWLPVQFELIPMLFQAASGHIGGIPMNFSESYERKRHLHEFVTEKRPVITDPVLNVYFNEEDPDGDFEWYRIEEIFFELNYFRYPAANGSETLLKDRRLFNALNS